MKFDGTKGGKWVQHTLPNGGVGIVDEQNKLIAYVRDATKTEDWDWVRKDCQKSSRK